MTDPAPDPRAPTVFSPLAHRDFRWLFFGFVVSHVGDSVQLHAQAWLVTELTRSGGRVGLVALAQAIPRLLLGLFAGVAIDRLDRRRVLFVTQTLALAQAVSFFALVRAHAVTYPRIVALAALLGVLDTINLNARVALMPTLVPRALIGKSVALQALGVNLVQIAGPSIAALLIARAGVAGCMAVNALSFLAALVALFVVRPPRHEGASAARSVRDDLREGFSFVRARPLLWAPIALAYLHGFFGVSVVRLGALFARVTVRTDGSGYGMLAAATGLGAVLASVLLTARAKPAQLPRNIVYASLGFSLALALLGRVHAYATVFVAMMLLGFGQMGFRSAVTTTIQLETPDRLRGRVVSLLTLDFSLWSVGALSTGLFVDLLAGARASALRVSVESVRAWALGLAFTLLGVVCAVCALALARTILDAGVHRAGGDPEQKA